MTKDEFIERHIDRAVGRVARCAGMLRVVLNDPRATDDQVGGALNFATQSMKGLLGLLWDDLKKAEAKAEVKPAPANGAQTRKG